MEPFTFDQLPHAVGLLHDKLLTIEQLLRDRATPSPLPDELLTISEAAQFLNLSVPTLYSKVSRREIPVNKQGKRLYFYKSELADWIKAGRKQTAAEISQAAERYGTTGRKGGRK